MIISILLFWSMQGDKSHNTLLAQKSLRQYSHYRPSLRSPLSHMSEMLGTVSAIPVMKLSCHARCSGFISSALEGIVSENIGKTVSAILETLFM